MDYGSTPENQASPFDPATKIIKEFEIDAAKEPEDNVLELLGQHLQNSELPEQQEEIQ